MIVIVSTPVTVVPAALSACVQMIFCNVEGVQWLDDVRLVIASDKAKKDQPFRCVDHDQRVSIFALPVHAAALNPPGEHLTTKYTTLMYNNQQLQQQQSISKMGMPGTGEIL